MLNVNLQVKIKNERSEIFQTDTGTPQVKEMQNQQ